MTNTTNTERLKPCPFCGAGNTEIHQNGRTWTGMKFSDPVSVSVRHWCAEVHGQPTRMIERAGRDEESAIAAWNTRAALAEAEGQAVPQGWHAGWLVSNSEGDEEFINNRNALEGRHYRGGAPLVLSASFECLAAAPEAPAYPDSNATCVTLGQLVDAAPAVAEPVAYVELTDAECDEFRRHQGDFNSMLRATHRAGYSRVVVSQPAPREPLTADEETKNKYGEWTHTIKGQPVSDNVPLKHECDGGSDYCMHCGIDMTGPYGSTPCDGLEQARRRQIKPETVAVFGCDAEARGLGACQQWCQGLQCPYTRSAAGDERTHGTGTDREGG